MKLDPLLVASLVTHRSEPAKILALFQEAGLNTARLSKINAEADTVHPYSRVVLCSTPECEVMLARWNPEQSCAPHNHGASAGWVFYLEQDFEEQSYTWRSHELVPTDRVLHPGGTWTEVRHGEIHSCRSRGEGLSLHVYFPRIEKMRVYDVSGRKTITVADDCGAWIPSRPEQLVQEQAWA